MKSVYNFVVTPIGERYNNTKKVEGGDLILNTEIYNHQYVNRLAKVISTPIVGDTDIISGDEIITHHNVFRRWHNQYGDEKNSRSYFNESTYFITQDQIFLYKRGGEWKAPKGYCFIQPTKDKSKFDVDDDGKFSYNNEKSLIGIVKYTDGTIKEGGLVGFTPFSTYEFIIDGKRLYRVMTQFITIKYEYQGDEEEYNPSWAESGGGVDQGS